MKNVFATRPTDFSDELADFRATRLELISTDSHSFKLQKGAKIVVHLIPQDLLHSTANHDLTTLDRPLRPLFVGGSSRFNFDGMVTYSDGHEGVRSYVQLFHNGAIEAVYVFAGRDDRKVIPSTL